MKARVIPILLFIPAALFSVTVRSVTVAGIESSDTNTILNFFHENSPGRTWADERELAAALDRFRDRLVRSGWFRGVTVSNRVENDLADVTVTLVEKMPYFVTVGNLYAGVKKYNLWGKGKSVGFEIGPVRQKISLEDPMVLFTRAGYALSLGQEEWVYSPVVTNVYQPVPAIRQFIEASAGTGLFPDFTVTLLSRNIWIKSTNGTSLAKSFRAGLRAEYDRRAGFPSVRSGFLVSLSGYYMIERSSWLAEGVTLLYVPIGRDFVIAGKAHAAVAGTDLPEELKFSLRGPDGLRTLSHLPGLTGNRMWDAHLEFRWNFWEVIPFLIFDMQLEALAFLEAGEARDAAEELGRPHPVYGAGLRIYLDTIGVRVEAGFDERGETSIITSFSLPF